MDFKAGFPAEAELRRCLSAAVIEEKFDLGYHAKHAGTICARVFGK